MAGETAVCTIVAKNYLAHARVLMESVRQHHPEFLRFVVLVDAVEDYFDPASEPFTLLSSEDFEIPDSKWFHFKYTILELSTAVKPYALELLLRRYDLANVIYLDPDIRLYSRLESIEAALGRGNVVLTPHLTSHYSDQYRPTELDILRSGVYNLGFIAVRNGEESFRFLKWWQQRLYDQCVVDLARGLFVDQRWVDLVPGIFAGVVIDRNPGNNVAYWNLPHRELSKSADRYVVNSSAPLTFFHFSGFDPDNYVEFSRHQNRYRFADLDENTRELVLSYRNELFKQGYDAVRKWPYAYGRFANGVAIPDMGRPVHHESSDMARNISDPFSDEGFRAFTAVWNQPIESRSAGRPRITRLAYRIYRSRADVQAAMPDIFSGDGVRFLEWVLSSGRSEHRLDDLFLAPVWDSLRSARKAALPASSAAAVHTDLARRLQAHGISTAIWHNPEQGDAGEEIASLNQLIQTGNGGLRLTRLARAIYESRPELQRFFPDPCGSDSVRFLLWLLTYGKKEHWLTEECLTPLREQWAAVLDLLPSPVHRAWYRLLLSGMGGSIAVRGVVQRVVSGATLALANARLRRQFSRDETGTTPQPEVRIADSARGVNLIGYFRSEMGVGESVRAAHRAATTVGLPVRLCAVEDHGPTRQQDHSSGPMSPVCDQPVNVFHVNADQTAIVAAQLGSAFYRDKYNVGYWAWETEDFPDRWLPAFASYDEIWTPSTFCRDAIARKSPVPVVRMPHAISVRVGPGLDRASFGLPADQFLFLTAFDVMSVVERKNPEAVIKAFTSAFRPHDNCALVLKINNADSDPSIVQRLLAEVPRSTVYIIDSVLSREATNALINCCDCMVSLHRAEGFGLMIAEAMYLGKPAIATAYSGNLDFTNADNSFLVSYKMTAVGRGADPYNPNGHWADPNVEQAAQHMASVYGERHLAGRVALNGKDFVHSFFSPEAVGRQMERRLDAIQHLMNGRQERARAAAASVSRAAVAEFGTAGILSEGEPAA